MSRALAAFMLRRWQFVALMVALLVGLGLRTFADIPRTEDPQTDGPMYYLTAVLPGATPLEVEQLVTKPIEDALYRISDVREVRSQSRDGLSDIYVEFRWGADADRKEDAIQRELAALRATLPKELARLETVRGRPTSAVIAEVALVADHLPMRQLEKLAERLRERLGSLPGVGEARYWGVPETELRVSLDLQRLAAIGAQPADVAEAVRLGGQEGPIGAVQSADRRFALRYAGAYPDAEAVGDVAIASANGGVLRVRDAASVAWETNTPDHLVRYNGRRAVLVTVTQNLNENVLAITAELNAALDAFERTLPGGVRLERPFFQAENVGHRLNGLYRDFVIALILVSLTLLPLGGRAAAVVMTAIPLSLLTGVIFLDLLGFSLNQLSIAGFVLALGILVDDAIVVIENIVRWLRGEADRSLAIIGATAQITPAVIGCTACLMFAFLPLLALPEASGEFVRSLPVAVLATVLGSLIVSLSVIPLVAFLLVRREAHPDGNRLMRALARLIERFYAPVLKRALDRPRAALALLFAATLLVVPLLAAIGSSLFPIAQTRQFLVRVEAPEGAPFSRTDRIVRRLEAELLAQPEVAWTVANIGRGNPPIYYNQPQRQDDPAFGEIVVGLAEWDHAARARLTERLRARYARLAGARVSVIEFVQGPVLEAPVVVRITGPEVAMLARLAGSAEQAMKTVPGLRDVRNPLRNPQIRMELDVDETAAAALGIRPGALRETLRLALSGVVVAGLRDAQGDAYPVRVRMAGDGPARIEQLSDVTVPTLSGGAVALESVATPRLSSGPKEIARLDRMRAVSVSANVEPGVLVSTATQAAEARVRSAVELPVGYRIGLGGEAESQKRSFAGLLPAVLIASFGILAVLVLEFGRFRLVAVVVAIVPFGFLGAIAALWLTGNSLSFTASIGLIALIGIEIKNSILLVDFAEQARRDGLPIRAAIEKAGELRFLPVVLTAVTAIGGLLPLAWENNGLYAPMAIAIIGGLVASTLLARIATPVVYLLLVRGDTRRERPA